MAEATQETKVTQIGYQIELEKLFNKNQLIPRIRQEFENCEDVSFRDYLIEKGIPIQFGMDVLVQMALHKRCNLPTLFGVLRHHFAHAQDTVDMILKCAEADLMNWDPQLKLFIVIFTISNDVQEDLDRFQYPLPMIVEPKEVLSNKDTGYILSKGSIILRQGHHSEDVCLDHINRANKIKYTLNTNTMTMVKNQWRNLDKPKEGESTEDFQKRKKAFEKYERTSKVVMDILLATGNEFHITHKYDKRGRTYTCGYHVNPQGTSYCKSVVEFANKEIIE